MVAPGLEVNARFRTQLKVVGVRVVKSGVINGIANSQNRL